MENNNKRRKLNNSEFTTKEEITLNINLEDTKDSKKESNISEEESNIFEEESNIFEEESNISEEESNTSEHEPSDNEEYINEEEFVVSEDSHENIDSLDYKYGNFQKYQDVSDYTTNYGENEDGDYEHW